MSSKYIVTKNIGKPTGGSYEQSDKGSIALSGKSTNSGSGSTSASAASATTIPGEDEMANPFASCGHSFKLIKSESSILYWTCQMCHVGPHWFIFECKYCRLKTCRNCTHCA